MYICVTVRAIEAFDINKLVRRKNDYGNDSCINLNENYMQNENIFECFFPPSFDNTADLDQFRIVGRYFSGPRRQHQESFRRAFSHKVHQTKLRLLLVWVKQLEELQEGTQLFHKCPFRCAPPLAWPTCPLDVFRSHTLEIKFEERREGITLSSAERDIEKQDIDT